MHRETAAAAAAAAVVAAQGNGERAGRARAAGTAPPTRHRNASLKSEVPRDGVVKWADRSRTPARDQQIAQEDEAGQYRRRAGERGSSSWPDRGRDGEGGSSRWPASGRADEGAGYGKAKPRYMPVRMTRQGREQQQPPYATPSRQPPAVGEEPPHYAEGVTGARPPADGQPTHQHDGGFTGARSSTDTAPRYREEERPPAAGRWPYWLYGRGAGAQPDGVGTGKTPSQKIERVSTLDKQEDERPEASPAPYSRPPPEYASPPPERPQRGKPWQGTRQEQEFIQKRRKRRPMEFCFTACCILFWLLVIAAGVAVLVVYLIYHPHPPQLRVRSATLNAGYVDELGGGAGGGAGRPRRALNADLTLLAAISSPNTVIHVVLRYMQLDLYFGGNLVGTQAVWPAPLHEGPGGSVLRSVHLVVSEVELAEDDVEQWQNATEKGGPVVLHLVGQFQTRLDFGSWFRFNYWIYPRCTLWLDPPPAGALRRARC